MITNKNAKRVSRSSRTMAVCNGLDSIFMEWIGVVERNELPVSVFLRATCAHAKASLFLCCRKRYKCGSVPNKNNSNTTVD